MAVNILLKRSATANKRPVGASMVFGELNLNYDAATGGLFYKDSNGDVVKVGPCQISATAPNSSPAGSSGNSSGEFWYDSTNGILKIWNGATSTWIDAAGGLGVETVTGTGAINVDSTDPANPVISVASATTVGNPGVVELSNGINDTSESGWAATPFAVSLVNDDVQTRLSTVDGGTMLADITMNAGTEINFTLNASSLSGVTNSTSTTSSTLAASATAVKSAYDLAAAALPASGGTLTGPLTFDAGQTFPISGIQDASTTQLGVVQLYDGTDSTSTTLALTANQGYQLQEQINALAFATNLTLAGTFNASTGLVDSVTLQGSVRGFTVGQGLPTPDINNADYFVIVDVAGSTGPAGTPPYHVGDWFLSDGSAWQFLNVGFQASAATTSNEGVVYLATDAEVQAGTDTSNKAINPASLQSKLSDSTTLSDSFSIASSAAVKSTYDVASAALPRSGGTMDGDLTIAATGGLIFGSTTSTALAAAAQLPVVVDSTTGELTIVDAFDAGTF